MADEPVDRESHGDGVPPAPAPLPVIPIEDEQGMIDIDVEDQAPMPVDDTLGQLARAEAELEAIDAGPYAAATEAATGQLSYVAPSRASRRAAARRGSPIWGILALSSAISCWTLLLLAWVVQGHGNVAGFALLNAVACGLGAIVLGTIGRRKPAARNRALIGRLMAWMTPGVAWSFVEIGSPHYGYRSSVPGELLVALAVLFLELAIGLFIFVLVDAALE